MYQLSKKSQELLGKYLIKELEHVTTFKFSNTVTVVYISEIPSMKEVMAKKALNLLTCNIQ